jgi:2-polyprenyl-3-methyl-5-hydroxy-6-metoxy-1,4-benzoquinol methylase
MGDNRRFDLFAKFYKQFSPSKYETVADVAGGKGYLQLALRQQGYKEVVTFDRRKKHIRGGKIDYHQRYFGEKVKDKKYDFNLIVGMHPDEATDHIIIEATKRGIP